MPTDFYQLAWSGNVQYRTHTVSARFLDATRLVDSIAETLMAAGWGLTGLAYPRTFIRCYHAFVGVRDGTTIPEDEREPAPCEPAWIRYGPPESSCGYPNGTPLASYNPDMQLPPPCDNFEIGYSWEETFDNMAAEIPGPVTAVRSTAVEERFGDRGYDLRGTAAGTSLNGWCYVGDDVAARTFTEGALWGGGYRLRSQTYNETWIEVIITATGAGNIGGSVRFDFGVNSTVELRDDAYPHAHTWPVRPGQEVTTLTTHEPHNYSIWACPYQFVIWAQDVDGNTFASHLNTAILATIPRVPVDKGGAGRAVICPGYYRPANQYGNDIRTNMTWGISWVSSDSTLLQSGGDVGIAGLRYPQHDLLTPDKKPLLHNPYVWSRHATGAGILGQLWDSVLVSSREFPRDSTMQFDRTRFRCMGRQDPSWDRTVGGLWFVMPDDHSGNG